jgi:FKBP-type peptidyl-prolyl cis-trans isomerase SlyD
MKVSDGAVVSLTYRVTDESGDLVDHNEDGRRFDYLHGHENIVSGLESALEGAEQGDRLQVTVEPSEGYGERDPNAVFDVPRDSFPDEVDVQPGMQFFAESPVGPVRFTVVEAGDAEVTVDGNHPLAGQTLSFDVEVVGVREATVEELAESRPRDSE